MKRLFLVPIVVLFSCASVVSGTRESITVNSTPPGADATLTCSEVRVDHGVTPTTLTLRRNAGDCLLTISRSGFTTVEQVIEQGVNPMYWGNFVVAPLALYGVSEVSDGSDIEDRVILGAAVGSMAASWLIDYATGAIHVHRPGIVNVTLRASEQ